MSRLPIDIPSTWAPAVERLAGKTPIAATLNSAEWAEVPLAIRERAFFSATIAHAKTIQDIFDDLKSLETATLVEGRAMDRSRIIERVRERLGALPGDSGSLQDITSSRRIGLIVDFQRQDAHGYAQWKRGTSDPDALNLEPAYRFIRLEPRNTERLDWPQRWQAAYARTGGQGAHPTQMVALKTSPIWAALSRFGRPWAPFDFGSGMGLAGIDRDEAEALGLLTPKTRLDPETAQQQFNDSLEASIKDLSPKVRQMLQTALGDRAQITGDTIRATPPAAPTPRTPETIRTQVAAAPDDATARRLIELPPDQRGKIQHLKAPTPALKPWVDNATPILESLISPDRLPQVRFVEKRGRASFMNGTVSIDPGGGRKTTVDGKLVSLSTIHELVHDLEDRNPAILQQTFAFLERRGKTNVYKSGPRKGQPRVTLTDGLPTIEDEWRAHGWKSKYVGKRYPDATEILTMGIERLIVEPQKFANQDPDYFNFLIGILQQPLK